MDQTGLRVNLFSEVLSFSLGVENYAHFKHQPHKMVKQRIKGLKETRKSHFCVTPKNNRLMFVS